MATSHLNKANLKDQTDRLFELDQWVVTYGGVGNELIVGKVVGFTPKQVALISKRTVDRIKDGTMQPEQVQALFAKPFQTLIVDNKFD